MPIIICLQIDVLYLKLFTLSGFVQYIIYTLTFQMADNYVVCDAKLYSKLCHIY